MYVFNVGLVKVTLLKKDDQKLFQISLFFTSSFMIQILQLLNMFET